MGYKNLGHKHETKSGSVSQRNDLDKVKTHYFDWKEDPGTDTIKGMFKEHGLHAHESKANLGDMSAYHVHTRPLKSHEIKKLDKEIESYGEQ